MMRAIGPGWRRVATVGLLAVAAILTWIGPAGRILLPFLVLPAWLSLHSLAERKETIGRIIASVVLVAATLIQLSVAWLYLDRLDPIGVVVGETDEAEWIERQRRSQSLVERGNEIIDPQTKTLVLGVNELFWFDGRVVGGANFDSGRIAAYLSGDVEEVARRMAEDGIESVLVYPRMIRVGQGQGPTVDRQRSLMLRPEAVSTLRELLERHGTIEAESGEAILYRLGR